MDKRYEEALERAKAGKPLDEIFPELKKSDDERIINAISVAICGETAMTILELNKVKLDDALAYLEKQKEQKPVKLDDDTEVGLDRALQIVKHARGNLRGYQSDDGIYECDHAIQTLEHILKNGIEQKPTGASEEDKKIIEDIILCLEYLRRKDTEREYNGDHNVNPRRYTVMIDKLKSFL